MRARSSIIDPAKHSGGPTQGSTAPADVAGFLRGNPGFLRDNPALYDVLDPPDRLYGAPAADHMAAMVAAARARAARAEASAAGAAAGPRATEGFARRAQEAVLALLRAPDPAAAAAHELPTLLRVDAARLCSEAPVPPPGAARVPRGTVATVLGGRPALVGPPDAAATVLHGEAAALAGRQALVHVPLRDGPALLALACRDAACLAGAATDTLAFLGQALAAVLDRA